MKREKHDWGVRLIDKPFKGLKNEDMWMQAEISKRTGQGTEVRFFFAGTGVDKRKAFRKGDLLVWIERLRALYDAANEETK
jgi:hypothetical protein